MEVALVAEALPRGTGMEVALVVEALPRGMGMEVALVAEALPRAARAIPLPLSPTSAM